MARLPMMNGMDLSRAAGARAFRCLTLALLTGAALWTSAASALAATNTVGYAVATALSAAPSPSSPANLGHHWPQHVDTTPPGPQPDTSPSHTIFFASAIKSNARYFPSCSRVAIDGTSTMPADCRNAVVGAGTATLYAGSPGSPRTNSVREALTGKLGNGPTGASVPTDVSSSPPAPLAITN